MKSQTKCSLLIFLFIFALKLKIISSSTNFLNSEGKNLKSNLKYSRKNPSSSDLLDLTPYNYPKNVYNNKDIITIAILGTNDIHGQAYEREIKYGTDTMKIGGFKLLSGYIKKMRSDFEGRFLWLDAGDQFTGTVEKERTGGSLMIDFYNLMKVDSVAVGNHESDKKEDVLRKWMKAELGAYADGNNNEWTQELYGKHDKNLYLTANLKMKEGLTDDLPNRMPVKIFNFEEGNIKIGVIGLITQETVAKTAGFNKDKYEILDYKEVVEQKANELRTAACNAVLILSHVGTNCKKPTMNAQEIRELYELKIRDNEYQGEERCDGEMATLLKNLTPGIIDGVIAGHIHESAHHFFFDIPVIQNPMSNIFTNLLYLIFKKDSNNKYVLDKNETKIEGPIPLCNMVYSNNKRCNEFQNLTNGITLKKFIFHGCSISPDPLVEQLFNEKYQTLSITLEEMKKSVIFNTEIRLERQVKKENVLGNLICDIIKKVTNSDISFYSPGALRYVWDIGMVSDYELNNMFPFGGNYGQKKMTGKMIVDLIKTLQIEGKMGYLYSFSGIKMTLIEENGKLKLDESNLILDNGNKLDLNKEYGVGSATFFLNGGDDVKTLVDQNKIGNNPITNQQDVLVSVKNELLKLKNLKAKDEKKYLGRIKYIKNSKKF